MKETEIDYKIKIIFSSYSLINRANGFPDGKSDCSKCKTQDCINYCSKSVPYQKLMNLFQQDLILEIPIFG